MNGIWGQSFSFGKLIDFLRHDVWRIRSGTLPRKRSFLLKQLRIIILAFRGFDEDNCGLRASALTFYSMIFGVAKGFALEKRVERELL